MFVSFTLTLRLHKTNPHRLCRLCCLLSVFICYSLSFTFYLSTLISTIKQLLLLTTTNDTRYLYRALYVLRENQIYLQSATCNLQLATCNTHLHAWRLTLLLNPVVHFNVELRKRPQSWASTPDIDEPDDAGRRPQPAASSSNSRPSANEDHNVAVTVKLPVPPRRHTTALDIKEVIVLLFNYNFKILFYFLDLKQVEHALTPTARVTSSPSKTSSIPDELVILSTDSLAERVRKMNLLKKQRSLNSRENSRERSVPRKEE